MLIEDEEFSAGSLTATDARWRDGIFRYCTFERLDLEGVQIDGIIALSAFASCDFYWGLFNTALIADTRFINCTFPGTSFRGARVVACTFERCRFSPGNIGGSASFNDCLVAESKFINCEWALKPSEKREVKNTRWLSCQQSECNGFDGLF